MIIAPVTMIPQWSNQLKVFFRPHAVDIFVFPPSQKDQEEFWSGDRSPWMKARSQMAQRIVLVQETVSKFKTNMRINSFRFQTIARQCTRYFSTVRPKGQPLYDSLPCRTGVEFNNAAAYSLFSRDWATVWIDEAHSARKVGRLYAGLQGLREKSVMMNAVTATPLYTSPKVSLN